MPWNTAEETSTAREGVYKAGAYCKTQKHENQHAPAAPESTSHTIKTWYRREMRVRRRMSPERVKLDRPEMTRRGSIVVWWILRESRGIYMSAVPAWIM